MSLLKLLIAGGFILLVGSFVAGRDEADRPPPATRAQLVESKGVITEIREMTRSGKRSARKQWLEMELVTASGRVPLRGDHSLLNATRAVLGAEIEVGYHPADRNAVYWLRSDAQDRVRYDQVFALKQAEASAGRSLVNWMRGGALLLLMGGMALFVMQMRRRD